MLSNFLVSIEVLQSSTEKERPLRPHHIAAAEGEKVQQEQWQRELGQLLGMLI